MNSQNPKLNILIVGAFGTLGTFVTRHCLAKPNLLVNILVRDPQKNKDLTAEVEKLGGKVFKGDITQPESYKGISDGIHTVIFTLPSFDDNVIVDGQLAMVQDCVANGVQRVVPSEFAENLFNRSEEELAFSQPVYARKLVRDGLKKLPIKVLTINTGILLESFLQLVIGKDYWGNGDKKLQITSYKDTAEFTACAVARENEVGHRVYVAHEASINEVAAIYNKVRGTSIAPKSLGSLHELKAKVKEVEEQGQNSGFLRLTSLVFDDRSLFSETNNKDFPEMKVTPIEDFIRQRTDINL